MTQNRPRLLSLVALTIYFSAIAPGASGPRSGWAFVPGAEDLIQPGQWSCSPPGITAGEGSLTVSNAKSDYITAINTSGPHLQVQGDFSVLATLSAPRSSGTMLTLTGTLNTGSEWWKGLKRLDVGFGFAPDMIGVSYYTGSSAKSESALYSMPTGTTDTINLEVARMGRQIVVFVNEARVASLPDPGIFDSGRVYFGFSVAPQNTLEVLALSATAPERSGTTLLAADLALDQRTGSGLRDRKTSDGFLIGAAVAPAFFSDSRYAETLGREFNLLVPENAMKFAETEPGPHQFNFCAGDQTVAFAEANGMRVRGHNLVWDQNLPSWLISNIRSNDDAVSILREHISAVMGHYKGKVIAWDVLNEAVADAAPYGFKPSYWLTKLGDKYVDMAFQWAHDADPGAKLFYNDYGGEGLGGKSDAIYDLVRGMRGRGVPIDGVGLQMHVDLNSAPKQSEISSNIARLGAIGLEVHITELDVRLPVDSNGNASAADQDAQALIYQSLMAACRAHTNCTAFLMWGVSDAHSWIPSYFPGFGSALLFDREYQPKPAYRAVSRTVQSAGRLF